MNQTYVLDPIPDQVRGADGRIGTVMGEPPSAPQTPSVPCARSPYLFVLATTSAAYETGQELGSPATVFAVLKATGAVAHRFDIDGGAGGLAVVS